jgi:hypothetical protein
MPLDGLRDDLSFRFGRVQVPPYRTKWSLKSNLKRSKIMVIKRRRKLKRQESWYVYGKQIQAVNAFSYLGITLDR